MSSRGVNLINQPSLFYALQTLQKRRVYYGHFMPGKELVAEEGIVNYLGSARLFRAIFAESPFYELFDALFQLSVGGRRSHAGGILHGTYPRKKCYRNFLQLVLFLF